MATWNRAGWFLEANERESHLPPGRKMQYTRSGPSATGSEILPSGITVSIENRGGLYRNLERGELGRDKRKRRQTPGFLRGGPARFSLTQLRRRQGFRKSPCWCGSCAAAPWWSGRGSAVRLPNQPDFESPDTLSLSSRETDLPSISRRFNLFPSSGLGTFPPWSFASPHGSTR